MGAGMLDGLPDLGADNFNPSGGAGATAAAGASGVAPGGPGGPPVTAGVGGGVPPVGRPDQQPGYVQPGPQPYGHPGQPQESPLQKLASFGGDFGDTG